jgi:hypothetical protein
MKNTLSTCSALAGLVGLMAAQTVAQEKSSRPAVVVAETNIVTATVTDIDHEKREVKLKDEQGNTVRMKVGEDVKNLDQVKKGDRVVAGYYQSVAVTAHKPGETPSEPAQGEAVIVSKKGQKPGGIAVKTTQVTATVEEIDYPTREVTLKGPEGNTVKMKVGERVSKLEDVKKGDRIVARYTEALAVSLAKPEE